MDFILVGAGQRGMVYARYAYENGHRIVAAADVDAQKLAIAQSEFSISEDMCFSSADELLSRPRMADAAIIATMDRAHYSQALPALEVGYHLLLEKPISPVTEETLRIAEAAKRNDRHVVVCHVLRYSPFFSEIKKQLDCGAIGRLISIQHNENIGNYHMAHSFVRGNWRNDKLSSSLMMQKSCHDMDILSWLVQSPCRKIASFGKLTYFKPENAPQNAAKRCCDCPLKDECRFSAYKCYLPLSGNWPATVLTPDQSADGIKEAIRTGSYGKCVYACDNNVCDHQVTVMEFENDVTATFNLSGFTNKMARTLKLMGENGEIRASEAENVIEVIPFAANAVDTQQAKVIHPEIVLGGHGGGDSKMMQEFIELVEGNRQSVNSDIEKSVESHLMVGAAEESRLTDKVVYINEFRQRYERN